MQTVSRLIHTFIPNNYNLSLTLERKQRTFKGVVSIKGRVPHDQGEIRLHAKDLTIESAHVDGKAAKVSHDAHDELVIEHKDITAGDHIVTIVFNGIITDAMHGLYPCYFVHDGEKKEMLATQFESHYAREVFPCVDEPEAKATFDLTLTTETGVTVLSNQPVQSQNEEDEKLVTTFATTPRMSTYLLAWVVGELHSVGAKTKSGVEVNVWATPAQTVDSLTFALDIATRTIDFFEEYFDTPYPLPKSDHVALPDFSSGAMENWGLITYRETALIADPKNSSVSSRRYVATVITHELSHQWFGNLVTMKWWNDLWLNESFANMMEYLAVDALQPDWNIWLDHASYETLVALRRDSLDGVQAIQTDVNHPDEISTLFDGAIVYAKGGRMIRMLQQYVGDEAFRKGLQAYFKKHAYKNTQADDLWDAIGQAAGKDIADLMHTWISQSGFPVLHVSQEGETVTLSQEQFFIGPHEPSDKLWPIPLGSTCSEMPSMLTEREVKVTRHHTTPLRFNSGGSAHFITHYSLPVLQQILDNLDDVPEIDRLQLLHEQTLLAQAGIISTADIIPLLSYYKNEQAEAVWDIIAVAINELKKFVEGSDGAEKQLRQLVGEIAHPQFERLGWHSQKGEPEEDTKLRATIASLMLYSEEQKIIEEALALFSNYLESIDAEIRPLVIGAKVRYGDDDSIIEMLLEAYKNTHSAELQQDIAGGITTCQDEATIKRLLSIINDSSVVRNQDFLSWFVRLLRNKYARDLSWQWVRDNWQWVQKTFTGDPYFDAIPQYVAGALRTKKHLSEYTAFFEPLKKLPVLRRNITIGVSEIEGRIALLERDTEKVINALVKN